MITIAAQVDADGQLSAYDTCVELWGIALRLGCAVSAQINTVLVTARPEMSPDEVWQRYKVDKAKVDQGATLQIGPLGIKL